MCFDKSTTDGLLCDTRAGAQRVKAMYKAVGASLRPKASVLVCSYRQPEDGFEWLVDVVIGGLREGTACQATQFSDAAEQPPGVVDMWSIDIHSAMPDDSGAACDPDVSDPPPPHVYLLRRWPRRVLRRRAAGRISVEEVGEEVVSVKHHWHG